MLIILDSWRPRTGQHFSKHHTNKYNNSALRLPLKNTWREYVLVDQQISQPQSHIQTSTADKTAMFGTSIVILAFINLTILSYFWDVSSVWAIGPLLLWLALTANYWIRKNTYRRAPSDFPGSTSIETRAFSSTGQPVARNQTPRKHSNILTKEIPNNKLPSKNHDTDTTLADIPSLIAQNQSTLITEQPTLQFTNIQTDNISAGTDTDTNTQPITENYVFDSDKTMEYTQPDIALNIIDAPNFILTQNMDISDYTCATEIYPQSIGPYIVESRLCRGRTSDILIARFANGISGNNPLKFALKRLNRSFSEDTTYANWLLSEIIDAQSLSHPNIAQIYHASTIRSDIYIVSEYIDGISLDQLWDFSQKRPPSIETVLHIAQQILAGLEFAHTTKSLASLGSPIVHQNLSASNIIVAKNGQIKITDLCTTQTHIPSPTEYIAPEQISIKKTDNPASNIYSVGIIIYQLLTGHSLAQLKQLGNNKLTSIRKDVNKELEKIIEKALAISPSHRYASAKIFHDVLDKYITINNLRITRDDFIASIDKIKKTNNITVEALNTTIESHSVFSSFASQIRPKLEEIILTPRQTRGAHNLKTEALKIIQKDNNYQLEGKWQVSWSPTLADGTNVEKGNFYIPIFNNIKNEDQTIIFGAPTYSSQIFSELVEFISVPSGQFMMGSPDDDPDAMANERPQHTQSVDAFEMAKTPITQLQWCMVMGSHCESAYLPKVSISWHDAIIFCIRLNQLAGFETTYTNKEGAWQQGTSGFRLPTEIEWEFACKAGEPRNTTEEKNEQLHYYAWYQKNTTELKPVSTRAPNQLGLCDMLGNVWEWCWSKYTPYPADNLQEDIQAKHKALRGGAWFCDETGIRATARSHNGPNFKFRALGFRVVRSNL